MPFFALAVARLVRVANDILAISKTVGRQKAILFAKILNLFLLAPTNFKPFFGDLVISNDHCAH